MDEFEMDPVMRGLLWFREDLRIEDNTALFQATKQCREMVAVFLIVPAMWRDHGMAPCRVEFILRGLAKLKEDLQKLHIPFLIHQVESVAAIPQQILQLMKQVDASILFCNRQYEVNERRRDQAVEEALSKNNLKVMSYDDVCILPPGSVSKKEGDYYKVFTAFKHAWKKKFMEQNITLLPRPKAQALTSLQSHAVPAVVSGFQSNIDPILWPAGERVANKRLHYFINNHLSSYDKQRDFPGIDATSRLSPYLSAGMISARQCLIATLKENRYELDAGNKGAIMWMDELIWRDFYKHILVAVPRVSMNRAYKPETEQIHWNNNDMQLQAWQVGRTGFPIIDAAMRQLNQTGWMHNRLRMIVAMFLAKNLLLDWRVGERYFIEHLIDGDLAANNGGWQWAASTGTDAVPYFRIFNPIRQSERFDPDGDFIRKYCYELAGMDKKTIHDPYKHASQLAKINQYPVPIVDINITRKKAIAAFKSVK